MCVEALRACTLRAMLSLFPLPPEQLGSRERLLHQQGPGIRRTQSTAPRQSAMDIVSEK